MKSRKGKTFHFREWKRVLNGGWMKDFSLSIWKCCLVISPPSIWSFYFLCRSVIYWFFSILFSLLWYQFKSLYKCPMIQYKVFFCIFVCIFFGVMTGGLTVLFSFFLQVHIYLTLFKSTCLCISLPSICIETSSGWIPRGSR